MRKRLTAFALSISIVSTSFHGLTYDVKAAETKAVEVQSESAQSKETSGLTVDNLQLNEKNFPDENFRVFLARYDKNGDGSLDSSEIEEVTAMDVGEQHVASLEGIQYFTSLLELNCEGNQLVGLDVTKLTELEILECGDNELESLNIKGLSYLTKVACGNNNLKSIDFTGVTRLSRLDCFSNQFTTLDVSVLTRLNNLDCSNNAITQLNLTGLTSLEFLYCGNNQLRKLELSKLAKLKILDCSTNQLETIDFSNNTKLTQLTLSSNKFIALDISMLSDAIAVECNKNSREVFVSPDKGVQLTLPTDFGTKMSDLKGADYDVTNNSLTVQEGAASITYLYQIGHGKTAEFEMSITDTKKINISQNKIELYATDIDLEAGNGKEKSLSIELFGFESSNITWRSENDAVATVTQNGRVKATGFGRTNIVVEAIDDESGSLISSKMVVVVYKQVDELELEPIGVQFFTNHQIEPEVKLKSKNGYMNSSDFVCEYDNNIAVGEASVIIKGVFPYNFTIHQTFKIQYDFSQVLIYPDQPGKTEFDFAEFTYTGKHIKPGFTAKYKIPGTEELITLKSGTHYSAEYSYYGYAFEYNPENPAYRTPKVYVKGLGDYYGAVTRYYSILRKEFNTDDFTVSEVKPQEYTGEAIIPPVGFTYKVSKLVLDSGDFDVVLIDGENSTNVGKAKVQVNFKGNYKGSYITEFDIVPRNLAPEQLTIVNNGNPTYSGNECFPVIEVSYDRNGTKHVLTEGTDYDVISGENSIQSGIADATIQLKGNYAGSKVFNYLILVKDATQAEVTIADQTYTGREIIPKAEVLVGGQLLKEGSDYNVTVAEDRNSTIVGKGYAKISFYGNYSGSRIVEYNITPKVLEQDNIQVSEIPDQLYTGEIIIPSVTVLDKTTRTQLELGIDYEVTAEKESNSNAGTAYVTIELKGNYSGSKKVAFQITRKNLVSTDISISGLVSKVYTGETIIPEPAVSYGKDVLVLDRDYTIQTISGKNHKNVGTAYFMIEFIGNFSGSQQISFNITKKEAEDSQMNISFLKSEYEYTGSSIYPELNVMYGDEALELNTDYVLEQIEEEDNINAGDVKVRLRFTKNYSGSKDVAFTIIPKKLQSSNVTFHNISNVEYTKQPVLPTVIVVDKDNNLSLTEGTDYQMAYAAGKNHTQAGEAYAKLLFEGNYSGVVEITYQIVPRYISHPDIRIHSIENQVYTGGVILPNVTIYDETTRLVPNVDYVISSVVGENQTNAGEAKVQLTMQGNYTGTKVLSYVIEPSPVEDGGFRVDLSDLKPSEYTGELILPDVPVYMQDRLLVKNVDYVVEVVEGKNGVSVGTGYARVRLIGNYSGSQMFEFKIVPMSVGEDEIEISGIVDQPYTGDPILPSVSVKVKGVTLTTADYYVESIPDKNNTFIGTAYANVILKNNYSGSKEAVFMIKASVTLEPEDLTVEELGEQSYTGKEIYPEIILKYGATELKLKKDYQLTAIPGENMTQLGEAKVRIELLNKYQGTKDITFTIVPRELTKEEVAIGEIVDLTYNRKAQLPVLSMDYTDIHLVKDVDYILSAAEGKNDVEAGTAFALVTFQGNFRGAFEVDYQIARKTVTMSDVAVDAIDSQSYTAAEILPKITMKDALDKSYTLVQGRDFEVVPMDKENCIEAGAAKAAIQFINNYQGNGAVEFQITPRNLSESEIAVDMNKEAIYTGSVNIPELTVKDGEVILTLGKDYTVAEAGNKNCTNAGQAYVLVSLQGNYAGSREFAYNILPKELSESQITIDSIGNKEYTASVLLPDVTVKYGNLELVKGKDFDVLTLKGKDHIQAGTKEALIQLKNNYAGSRTVTYQITPKVLSGENTRFDAIENKIFTGSSIVPDTLIYDGDITLISGRDYTLTGIDGQNNRVVGDAYVRADFIGNYTGSLEMSFQIEKKELTAQEIHIDEIADITYTGSEVIPELVVKDGDTLLVKDSDYTVSIVEGYQNTNAGTGAVKVTLCGNYSGSRAIQFTIAARELEGRDVTVADIPEQTFTGTSILPNSTVLFGAVELQFGADYDIIEIANRDCVNAGNAMVRYQFKGNYSGSKDVTFKITAQEVVVSDVKVVLDEKEIFTGGTILPDMEITYRGTSLKAGTDYKVAAVQGENSTNVGQATVKIEFVNNYSGSSKVSFTIIARELSKDTIQIGNEKDIVYRGEGILPEIELKYQSIVLKNGVDYNILPVKGENNTEVGDALVEVKFRGNYLGCFNYPFTIVPKVLSEDEIYVKEIEDQIYTGEEIIPVLVVKDGEKTLVLEKDYVVNPIEGANNKAIGEAALNLSLQGNYSGSKNISFNIVRKNVAGSDIIITEFEDDNFTSTIVIPEVIVWDGNVQLKEGTDYTVEILKLPNNMNSIKIHLKGEYANSPNITYNIISKTIDSNILSIKKIDDQPYTGEAIIPSVKIRYGKITLTEGEDYMLSKVDGEDNTAVGAGKVLVEFMNNFSGSAELTFSIVPAVAESEEIQISEITSPEYSGETVLPDMKVSFNGKELVKGTDYYVEAIEGENQAEVGSAKAKVVLTGNYAGSKLVEYTIAKRVLDEKNIVIASISDEVQTGSIVLPELSLVFNGVLLEQGVDFKLELIEGIDYVEVGVTKVKVSFMGNFKGELIISYRIVGEKVESKDIEVEAFDAVFHNKEIIPEVKLTFNRSIDTSKLDYAVEILEGEDSVNVGEVKAKVVLKGYCSGSKEFTFKILPKVLTDAAIVIDYEEKLEENGAEQILANLTISYGDWILTEGKDYRIEKLADMDYSTVGEKIIQIYFQGNYEGTSSVSLSYEITEAVKPEETMKSLLDESITLTSSALVKYTGEAVLPTVVIKDGEKKLVKNVDYTLTGSDNIALGTGTVVIEGIGAYKDSITKTFTIKVGTQRGVAVKTPGTASIKLAWTKQKGVSGYEVFYYHKTKKKYVILKRLTGSDSNTYTHAKLGKLKQYQYKVRAFLVVDGVRKYGTFSSVLTTSTAPAKEKVTAKASTNSIKLSWNKQAGVSGYEVYYYHKTKKKYVLLKRVASAKTVSYTHSKLKAVTEYKYKVRAYKTVAGKRVYGSFSAVMTKATTPAVPKVTLTAKSKSVAVKWNKVKNAAGYEVYTSAGKNGKYKLAKKVTKGSTVTYTVKSLKKNQTVYVKVRAYKVVNRKKVYSGFSTVKLAKAK